MTNLTLFAVAAFLLLDLLGSKSSVGGPMADLLLSFAIMLAVGFHASWGRGPMTWFISIFVAIVGGILVLFILGSILEPAISALHLEGRLATSNHPLRYVIDVIMPTAIVLGAWLPLQLLRSRPTL